MRFGFVTCFVLFSQTIFAGEINKKSIYFTLNILLAVPLLQACTMILIILKLFLDYILPKLQTSMLLTGEIRIISYSGAEST